MTDPGLPLTTGEGNTAAVEALAAEFHAIYQAEAKRQRDVRHHDDYDALPENVKEFDRVLAREVLRREAALREHLDSTLSEIAEYVSTGRWTTRERLIAIDATVKRARAALGVEGPAAGDGQP